MLYARLYIKHCCAGIASATQVLSTLWLCRIVSSCVEREEDMTGRLLYLEEFCCNKSSDADDLFRQHDPVMSAVHSTVLISRHGVYSLQYPDLQVLTHCKVLLSQHVIALCSIKELRTLHGLVSRRAICKKRRRRQSDVV